MSAPLSLRFAAREMRAGVRGFRIFLACLALGVAAVIATHNMELARFMDRVYGLKDGHLETRILG